MIRQITLCFLRSGEEDVMQPLLWTDLLLPGAAALVFLLEVLAPVIIIGIPLLINKYKKRRNRK